MCRKFFPELLVSLTEDTLFSNFHTEHLIRGLCFGVVVFDAQMEQQINWLHFRSLDNFFDATVH